MVRKPIPPMIQIVFLLQIERSPKVTRTLSLHILNDYFKNVHNLCINFGHILLLIYKDKL